MCTWVPNIENLLNKALQPTASSIRSSVAPAFGSPAPGKWDVLNI
jgi:hypothetical protein